MIQKGRVHKLIQQHAVETTPAKRCGHWQIYAAIGKIFKELTTKCFVVNFVAETAAKSGTVDSEHSRGNLWRSAFHTPVLKRLPNGKKYFLNKISRKVRHFCNTVS